MLGHASEHGALDVQILLDHFDDPVGFSDALEIVLEVADLDETGEAFPVEGGGSGLQGSL